MVAIAKIKFGLKLLAVAPLAASIALVSTSLSTVQSQTLPSNSVEESAQLTGEIAQFSINNSTPIFVEAFFDASQLQANFSESANFVAPTNYPQPSSKTIAAKPEELDNKQSPQTDPTNAPFPGAATTDATALSAQPSSAVNKPTVPTDTPELAQLPLDPGRRTRGGSSYIGIGANVGLSGDTALGDGNFMIISKIGLTRALALRPGVVLGDDAIFLLPLTYEFSIRQAEALEEALRIAPYIGAGVTISTSDEEDVDDIGLLLTGGVDIPLSSQFTANAGLNIGIADETDIGLSVGVGYNFGGFGL